MSVVCYGQSGEMVCHNILYPLFVFNLQLKFLEQKDPSNKSSFGILLGKEVLQG